jgi:uncharacterized membrane protein YphA (DoxX/SURF4 family)
MKKPIFLETITFMYIALFLYTGISKLFEYDVFREQLASSPILGPIAPIVAVGLPISEFLLVALLIIPKWRLKGLYSALILMLLFTIYVITLLSINKELPCSCGGIISLLSWPEHLIFNISFIALAIWAILIAKTIKKENQRVLTDIARNTFVI